MAETACKLGATDKDLAEMFGVCEATINNWKHDHPGFLESLKSKSDFDDQVEQALFRRATGCKVRDDKVFNQGGEIIVHEGFKEYPPDTAAAYIWLKNRRPEKWRDDPANNRAPSDININIVNPHASDSTD